MNKFTTRVILLSILGLSSFSFASELQWSDPSSGRQYTLLLAEQSWNRAYQQCRSRGLALMDMRFLSEGERKEFLSSPIIGALKWRNVGSSSERSAQTTSFWQSAQAMTITENSELSSSIITLLRKGNTLSTASEWESAKEHQAASACMTVPGFWYKCSAEYRCEYEERGQRFAIRYLFADFGETRNAALQRIVERSQDQRFASSEGKCALLTEGAMCTVVLP